jgi:hypothetical protein
LGLVLIELLGFGIDLNPAIDPGIQTNEPPVLAVLRSRLQPGQRALGIGQELPPNVLMRFGLADPRNYDSIELASSLKWLEPLYEPGPEALSSRREITWEGVHRARERLEECCVAAVVGATPPPSEWFPRVERVGDVWIAWLDPPSWATLGPTPVRVSFRVPGQADLYTRGSSVDPLVFRESWAPGWRARVDTVSVPVRPYRGAFLAIDVPASAHPDIPEGFHIIEIKYSPNEVIFAICLSIVGLAVVILALTGPVRF